jgi:cyclopropane-fatty-acyl-phospholipid synthase
MQFGLLQRHVVQGELTVVEPDGRTHHFGRGVGAGEPRATWILHDPSVYGRILANPAFELGQTYMDGRWDAGEGGLAALLRILRGNLSGAVLKSSRLAALACVLQSWNNVRASLHNVTRHYDLDEALFRACLDRDMHYSCAYFENCDTPLDDAQAAKCRHVARKLLLEDGQRVLDIGCGWGALAIHLARLHDVAVTGLTLSQAQLRVATAAAQQRQLDGRVTFRLEDYRQHRGEYDRIVSVGMFEHVGRRYHRTFVETLERLLRPGGVAVLHTIVSTRPPAPTNPWMRRYIFPGGYIPTLGEIGAALEGSALAVADVEVLRDHYALTLHAWHRRFQAARAAFVASHGEAFCRMWEFYLMLSATAFECGELVVQQWQLARAGAPLPRTRAYLYAAPA